MNLKVYQKSSNFSFQDRSSYSQGNDLHTPSDDDILANEARCSVPGGNIYKYTCPSL